VFFPHVIFVYAPYDNSDFGISLYQSYYCILYKICFPHFDITLLVVTGQSCQLLVLNMLALIQLFRVCSEPIALHIEFLLAPRTSSPIRTTLKRFCVYLRLIVLEGIWAAAIISQCSASQLFPRLFKVSKVVDFLRHAEVVKFCVGAVSA
jgi:hypothetical protein